MKAFFLFFSTALLLTGCNRSDRQIRELQVQSADQQMQISSLSNELQKVDAMVADLSAGERQQQNFQNEIRSNYLSALSKLSDPAQVAPGSPNP